MSSGDQPPRDRDNTLPGFPEAGVKAPGEPVLVVTSPIGEAPTEPAMRSLNIMEETVAVASAMAADLDTSFALVDPAGRVRVIAEGGPLLARLGWTVDEIRADPAVILSEEDYLRVIAAYRSVLGLHGKHQTVTFDAKRKDGDTIRLVAEATNRVREKAGATVIAIRPEVADHDAAPPIAPKSLAPAEGALDREAFIDHLGAVVARKVDRVWSAPSHTRGVLRDRRWDYALVLIHLDRFNLVMGGFGTEALDKVRREACQRVTQVLRSRDVVGEIGPTDIAVLMEGVSDDAHAMRLTDMILGTIRDRFVLGDNPISLIPIAGIATSMRRYETADAVLQDAAAAAGRALQRGSGPMREAFETEFRTDSVRRLSLMGDLQQGIEQGELFLLFQPILNLANNHVQALEAYVRWRHPVHGIVMPSDFIPLAEETGLIRPLTHWVLRAGCERMNAWARDGALRLHVNVGAPELSDRRFAKTVMNALEDSGLSPTRLCLEMSETALMEGTEIASENMFRLSAKGVRFALDDYGTGSSSLNFLAELPFDFVKIDTSLSQHVDETKRRVVRAMIGLAHELGREVIAEGVESEPQRDALAALGSDEAQGYFFGRPVEAEAMKQQLGV